MHRSNAFLIRVLALLLLFVPGNARAAVPPPAVVISEIHYHPAEEPAFTTNGTPVLDLTNDIHEFVELWNPGTSPVALTGWRLDGGIGYDFPPGTVLNAGTYLVVARNPARLSGIAAYRLQPGLVLGPYTGFLGNDRDVVELRDPTGLVVDLVGYSSHFPWPLGADSYGAHEEWSGVNPLQHQYRGRSLERVSPTHDSNDPANWIASPLHGDPSPGRPGAVQRAVPQPVVIRVEALQASNRNPVIRSNQPVLVECSFSSATGLTNVAVEFFTDRFRPTNAPAQIVDLAPDGAAHLGHYRAVLPAHPSRALVRYRILADRGSGREVVSPRPDDPLRWHAFFVTPVRVTTNDIYEVFIATNSLTRLRTNISQNPRRVTAPDPPGFPRASWNATEPAALVHNGVVYDIRMRYHGSRFRRAVERASYKVHFPNYQPFQGKLSTFITDKDNQTVAGHAIFRAVRIPTSETKWVDFYLNDGNRMLRLEQQEYDQRLIERYHNDEARLNEWPEPEETGEMYKSVGLDSQEGPYGRGDGRQLAPVNFRGTNVWTPLQRYEWTYSLQNHGWKGHTAFKEMLDAHWVARTTNLNTVATNRIPALRAYFERYWDVDTTLTYLATINWMAPWDDTFHNHFFWRNAAGRWCLLPWDFDSVMSGQNASTSIYNGAPFAGPQFFKQSFITAFRQEFTERIYLLNNTTLHPDNLPSIGAVSQRSWANSRLTSVNNQTRLGLFSRPSRPVAVAPPRGALASGPLILESSGYLHTNQPAPAHVATRWEIRTAQGSYAPPLVSILSSNHLTRFPAPQGLLVPGETYFWRCAHVDAQGHPSLFSTESPVTLAVDILSSNDSLLNEVLVQNRSHPLPDGSLSGYVELRNRSAASLDLSGMSLSDDLSRPLRFTFPQGSIIPPSGHLLVRLDAGTGGPLLHAGFFLPASGGALFLFDRGSVALRDVVRFGNQIPDLSLGRDTTSAWLLNRPSPGAANLVQPLGRPGFIRINEWSGGQPGIPGWIELANLDTLPVNLSGLSLTDDLRSPNRHRFPPLSFLGAGGFLALAADGHPERGGDRLPFRLAGDGELIALYDAGRLVDTAITTRIPEGSSIGRYPDGGEARFRFDLAATPGAPNHRALTEIALNELLPLATPPFDSAVELQNLTSLEVDLSRWELASSPTGPPAHVFPAGTRIAPAGFLVVYGGALVRPTPSAPLFPNPGSGGTLFLFETDSTGQRTGRRTSLAYGPARPNVSVSRPPDGAGGLAVETAMPSFGVSTPGSVAEFRTGNGAANPDNTTRYPRIGEIMYHPPLPSGAPNEAEALLEFVELWNPGATPFPLHHPMTGETLGLRGGIQFNFPSGSSIPAGDAVVVVGFDPSSNPTAAADFRSLFPNTTARLFGPFLGRLRNSSDRVALVLTRPSGEPLETVLEELTYADQAPWPAAADGTGLSLTRPDLASPVADPDSWLAATPTPGTDGRTLRIQEVAMIDGRLRLRFSPRPGKSYALEHRTALGSGTWERVRTFNGIIQESGVQELPLDEDQGFYRITELPSLP